MSDAYAAVYSVVLPRATRPSTPSMSVSLANRCLDAVRRRVQSEQTGHRGRETTPSIGRGESCSEAKRRLDDKATERFWSLLALGDPGAEVAIAYRIKERLRDFYRDL